MPWRLSAVCSADQSDPMKTALAAAAVCELGLVTNGRTCLVARGDDWPIEGGSGAVWDMYLKAKCGSVLSMKSGWALAMLPE